MSMVQKLMQQHGTAHRGILDEAGYVLAAIAESDEPDSTVSSVLALARYGIYNELQRWSAHWAATPVEGIARCLAVMPCVRSTFLLASTFSCAAPHVQLLQTNCNSHYYYEVLIPHICLLCGAVHARTTGFHHRSSGAR